MSRSKRAAQQFINATLEKKLTKYLVAGGAVLAAPMLSYAGSVTYSGPIDEVATSTNPVLVSFPGGPSFSLQIRFESPFSFASVFGTSTTFLEGNGGEPAALNFGSMIAAANATGTAGELLGTGPYLSPVPHIGYKGGNWPQDGSSAYLGLSFTTSGQTYAGWAQIAVDLNPEVITAQGFAVPPESSATLTGYAFTTDGSILAGQTVGSSTPEPSSLALFAIGGAAALALLRRRRAAAQSN